MTAAPLPKDPVVLTDAQIDAYITYQMARLEFLLARRRRAMSFTQPVRLVPCV